MPQMAPIFWAYLFVFFFFVFIIFLAVNYFIKPYSHSPLLSTLISYKFKSWKL